MKSAWEEAPQLMVPNLKKRHIHNSGPQLKEQSIMKSILRTFTNIHWHGRTRRGGESYFVGSFWLQGTGENRCSWSLGEYWMFNLVLTNLATDDRTPVGRHIRYSKNQIFSTSPHITSCQNIDSDHYRVSLSTAAPCSKITRCWWVVSSILTMSLVSSDNWFWKDFQPFDLQLPLSLLLAFLKQVETVLLSWSQWSV